MRSPPGGDQVGDSLASGFRRSAPAVDDRTADVTDVWGIFLVGSVLALTGVVTVFGEHASDNLITALFYGFTDVCLPLAVLGAGYYLTRTTLTPGDVRHVTVWFLGGIAFLWFLYLWSKLPFLLGDGSLLEIRPGLVLFGSIGGVVGLIAGINRARAHQNRRLVERTADQQDTLEFINHLLRHNILNGLQVIDGYAEMLEAEIGPDGRAPLNHIQNRTRHMTDLIDNVRVLMRTFAEDAPECGPIDLSTTLREEVEVARSAFPTATFEADVPDGVHVEANDLVGAVFENLLANAVVHNDAPDPHVEVRLRAHDGVAEVRIADDGPGIPSQFQHDGRGEAHRDVDGTSDGLGLYLVEALVEAFGGSFGLETHGDDGTTAVVRIPLAEAPESDTEETPAPVEAALDD